MGWRTKRHIIVFESDDWGSIRMPSLDTRNYLESQGFDFRNQSFNLYDSLESNDDLSNLFDVLTRYNDLHGNHPVITALTIVGNPDFDLIREHKYEQYFWEPFIRTLDRYPARDRVYSLYKYGIKHRIFVPEFHGREHLHVQRWLRLLRSGNRALKIGFDNRLTGLSVDQDGNFIGHMQAAFDMDTESDLYYMKDVISEGLLEFEKIFGYRARYFVPTNGPFNNSLEAELKGWHIDYLLKERIQKEPYGNNVYKKHLHYLGKKNKYGQIYLTRNCFFEPSLYPKPLEQCISGISNAFMWGKPAVISTHRLNYMGSIDINNRERSLKLLDSLLSIITERWPDVEFMSSSELGDIIAK